MNKRDIVAHLRTPDMIDFLERANEKVLESRAQDPNFPLVAWTTKHRMTELQRDKLPRLHAWSAMGFIHHVKHDTYALALHYRDSNGQVTYGTLYPDGAMVKSNGSRTLELHLQHMRPGSIRTAKIEHAMDPIPDSVTFVNRHERFTGGHIRANSGWDV